MQGWVECVGCADRSAYDLNQHTIATGVKLVAERKLPAPKKITAVQANLNKAAVGKNFKKDAKIINDFFAAATEEQLAQMNTDLTANG